MDKLNNILVKYPKASALIPISALLIIYAYLTSIPEVLKALSVGAGIVGILLVILVIVSGKDLDDDDWWTPGGPRPV